MIREASIEDISAINKIGLRINDNYASIYNLSDVLNQNYSKIYVYEDANIIKGFLHIENHYEITDIINIAVLKCFENNKIASQLLDYLFKTSAANKIMLEVRADNQRALTLYKRKGFKEIHRRPNYYTDTDAIIMERSIYHVRCNYLGN